MNFFKKEKKLHWPLHHCVQIVVNELNMSINMSINELNSVKFLPSVLFFHKWCTWFHLLFFKFSLGTDSVSLIVMTAVRGSFFQQKS